MNQRLLLIAAFALFWIYCASPIASRAAVGIVTIEPKPSAGVLLNPGKGWSAMGLPADQPKEVLDLVGMGVRRIDWARLEPQEGQYDWRLVDEMLESWARLGKVCNIGVACANTSSRIAGGYVTPKWVFDAGAKKIEIELNPKAPTSGSPGHKIAPVFDDPVFLEKLHHFVQAFAKRYDGDPRIALLDIRSYGNWGEAHMSPFNVPDIAPEKFRELVQMYLDVFKRTQLCLSRNSNLGRYGRLKEVFDWAVLDKHIAPRRDGICGNSDGSETAIGFGLVPGVFEMYDNYDRTKELGWWDGVKDKSGRGFRLADCIENGKPTWVDLARGGKSGLRMLRENRPLIERLTNRIGYHFHLQRAVFPRQFGDVCNIELSWRNQGVAPIYLPCAVALALIDDQDTRVSTIRLNGMDPKRWMPDKTTVEMAAAKFADVRAGEYRLALAITPASGEAKSFIRLGTELPQVNAWFVLGKVLVAR